MIKRVIKNVFYGIIGFIIVFISIDMYIDYVNVNDYRIIQRLEHSKLINDYQSIKRNDTSVNLSEEECGIFLANKNLGIHENDIIKSKCADFINQIDISDKDIKSKPYLLPEYNKKYITKENVDLFVEYAKKGNLINELGATLFLEYNGYEDKIPKGNQWYFISKYRDFSSEDRIKYGSGSFVKYLTDNERKLINFKSNEYIYILIMLKI